MVSVYGMATGLSPLVLLVMSTYAKLGTGSGAEVAVEADPVSVELDPVAA